jgi:hypothetical protein
METYTELLDEQAINDNIVSEDEIVELANSSKTELNALPYRPASEKCLSMGSVSPTKLYYEIQYALRYFRDNNIDTTEFVREKLNYTSTLAVCNAFSAEQVDAIALGIRQFEQGGAFILGDGTGVGKGRVCAGMLRYAYISGFIPVFLTKNTSLFSDIYRDIKGIGGFDSDNKLPKPFILNGQTDSEIINGQKVFQSDIILDEQVLFKSQPKKEIFNSLNQGSLPIGYDIILLTYSVISADRFAETKSSNNVVTVLDFFSNPDNKSFVILDESHLAAGESNVSSNLQIIINKTKVFFSSATFAKTYKNLKFYIPKTILSDLNIENEEIGKFVDAFKDNALEFIAQGLCEAGQMIRREKTLEGCEVMSSFQIDKKDFQYQQYNKLIFLLRKITQFCFSKLYLDALSEARNKVVDVLKIELAESKPSKKKDIEEWKIKNEGKFQIVQSFAKQIKNRNSFIENLLFAIKADFVADKVIEKLTTKSKYINKYSTGEEQEVETYLKPLVACRNTGESNLIIIDKENGQELSNYEADFSYALIKILEDTISGYFEFLEVHPTKKPEKLKKIFQPIKISMEQFSDGGEYYNQIVDEIKSTISGLPISPLDYIINKVNSHQRNDDDYAFTKSKNLIIEDTTKRTKKIIKNADGNWVMASKSKENDVEKIKRFNSGKTDSIIINVAASTGSSFHSSETFTDKRKRSMLIHQVELDVSTEMQKLGRVNRTGQVNFPEYDYVISMIPTEIRRLMALRRKLRSLSANTTGNMNQAASYSEFRDIDGKVIEDIFTKYGWDAINVFIDSYGEFKQYLPDLDSYMYKNADKDELVNTYCRNLELASSEEQEFFYNEVNRLYSEMKRVMIQNGDWDLDSDIINFKASEKNKAILFNDNGNNAFSAPVYIQDVYVNNTSKPYSKEEMIAATDRYSKGKNHNEFHKNFLEELVKYRDKYEKNRLDKELYDEEYDIDGNELKGEALEEVKKLNEDVRQKIISDMNAMFDWMIDVVKFLYIGRPCIVPFNDKKILKAVSDYDLGKIDYNQYEQEISSVGNMTAKIIGYKIDSKDGNLNPSNITVIFAVLGGTGSSVFSGLDTPSEYRLKPTRNNRAIFEEFILPKTKIISKFDIENIAEWVVKTKSRSLVKTLTGNLLRAYSLYDSIKKQGDKTRIATYTTSEGGLEKGIIISNMIWQDMPKEPEVFEKINSDIVLLSNNFIPLSDGLSYLKNKKLHIYFKSSDPKSKLNSKLVPYISELKQIAIINNIGFKELDKVSDYTFYNGKQSKKSVTIDKYIFDFEKPIANLLYEKTAEAVLVSGITLLYGQEDVKAENGVLEEIAIKGEYYYTPEIFFDKENTPPNFKELRNDPQYSKGIVVTEYDLNPAEAQAFKLVPVYVDFNLAYNKLIARLKTQRNLETFINYVKENKDEHVKIFFEAQKLSLTTLKYLFGNIAFNSLGKFISDKVLLGEVDVLPVIEKQEEKIEVLLNLETAQEFLIKFRI